MVWGLVGYWNSADYRQIFVDYRQISIHTYDTYVLQVLARSDINI